MNLKKSAQGVIKASFYDFSGGTIGNFCIKKLINLCMKNLKIFTSLGVSGVRGSVALNRRIFQVKIKSNKALAQLILFY